MSRHVEVITLISFKCRNEVNTVILRSAYIDSLYRCTIVVTPIEVLKLYYLKMENICYIFKSTAVASAEENFLTSE